MTEQRRDFKADLEAIEANIMAGDMSAHQVFTMMRQMVSAAPQVAAPEGWRLSRIALDQVEIITPAGEKHWVESNSEDPLELVLYALIDAMLAAATTATQVAAADEAQWPEPTDEMTRYLQERARDVGMAPSVLNPAVACLAGLIMADMQKGEREIAARTLDEFSATLRRRAREYSDPVAVAQVAKDARLCNQEASRLRAGGD